MCGLLIHLKQLPTSPHRALTLLPSLQDSYMKEEQQHRKQHEDKLLLQWSVLEKTFTEIVAK